MITVVNMIPKSLSKETNQDSEPSLAVNPANPLQIVGTAFTPDPLGGEQAPIYVSADGGATWRLNSIVPSSSADGSATADITVAFGGTSNKLYAGIIRLPFPPNRPRLNILRTNDVQSATVMKVLVDRTGTGVDQPYVQATTVASGTGAGKDRVYVGDNDFNALPRTATFDRSLNAGISTPTFGKTRIEPRDTGSAGQDGPAIRPAIHGDGTVYGAYYGWRTFNRVNAQVTADVVLVRDDKWAAGYQKFKALKDPGDNLAGRRVAQGVTFTWDGTLGQQRLGGDVAIAVDPRASATVYLAWAGVVGGVYTLHLRRSTDRGLTWSPADLRAVPNALNPALAVNSEGRVGFLYQQLSGVGASARWVTSFERSLDGTNWDALVLATVPAQTPAKVFDPYLGDYVHLQAVGTDFYGVFCANNTPDTANFPNGVTFQRNADFATHRLLALDGATSVGVSIDPFFFKVTPA
jgi:hypothetical protein